MAKNYEKRILMFSAGLDSFIVKTVYHFTNDECLFVKMGTPENEAEEHHIDKYFPGVLKADLPISEFALENNIIPFRNHMLCMIGGQFGNSITFGFTAGDTTRDKDLVFKSQMEGTMNYFALSADKVHHPAPYSIEMPMKHLTKSEMVDLYLRRGYNPLNLLDKSRSCYSAGFEDCGACRSCLRKYVAIYTADRLLGEKFRNGCSSDPIHLLDMFYTESADKGRSEKELKEIEICMRRR